MAAAHGMSSAERPRSGAPMEKGFTERGPRETVRTLTKAPAGPGLCLYCRVMLHWRMDRALTVPAPGGPFRTGFPDHGRQMTTIARSVDPQLGGDLPPSASVNRPHRPAAGN